MKKTLLITILIGASFTAYAQSQDITQIRIQKRQSVVAPLFERSMIATKPNEKLNGLNFQNELNNPKLEKTKALMSKSLLKAARGSEGVGGGDIACENRIKNIREDFNLWIRQGGHQYLDLKGRGSAETYKHSMLEAIARTKIQCVGEGNPGFPIIVFGIAKTCAVETGSDQNLMTCDFKRVTGHTDEELYQLVHHEFATLAGFEKPNGGDSDYEISNQISAHLVDQVVKRLAVNQNISACGGLNLRTSPVGTKCRTSKGAIFERVSRLNFGEAWRGPDGIIWSDVIGRKNHRDAFETCTEELGAFFPAQVAFENGESFGFREVLPGFSGRKFWVGTSNYVDAPVFFGDYGTFLDSYDPLKELDFRCAAKK